MSTKPSRLLKDIPWALFEEHGDLNTLENIIKTDNEDRLSINMCKVLDSHFKHMTLVHHVFTCSDGKHNSWTLQLFADEVDFSMFDLYEGNSSVDPLVTITVGAVHPLPNSDTTEMDWVKGRGFWVNEVMTMYPGGPNTSNFTIALIGTGEDILAYFLVSELIKSAYEKGLNLQGIGHWQSEWHPNGKYRKKPSKIK